MSVSQRFYYVFEGSEKSIKELYENFLKSVVTDADRVIEEWISNGINGKKLEEDKKELRDSYYKSWGFDRRKIFPMEYGQQKGFSIENYIWPSDNFGDVFPKDENLIIKQLKKSWTLELGAIINDNIPFTEVIPKYYPDVKIYWYEWCDLYPDKSWTNDKKHRFF